MRILITPDILSWAIGNLTNDIIRHNPRFNWVKIPVHPRAVTEHLFNIKLELKNQGIDFWHAQYWNSAVQLMKYEPKLKQIPKLLSHHNHYALEKEDWRVFNGLHIATHWGQEVLKRKHEFVYYVPYGVDLDRFSFMDNYPPQKPAIGYVGRVVPWKNLDKICAAAKKLGYRVFGSGYVDDPKYWETIDKSNLTYYGGVGRGTMAAANVKDDLYAQMTVFVGYYTGEKETGTLPLLEAMARGVPVMVTSQGMARDIIEDGKNGIIFTPDNFEEKLQQLINDKDLRESLRQTAWKTIKNYPTERFARETARMYYDIIWNHQPVISVIIPTFNRWEQLMQTIVSIDNQEYPAKEIIVCDDGSTDNTRAAVEEIKKKIFTPIMYVNTYDTEHYGLAKARNMGVMEALGSILLFLDDRFTLQSGALEQIAQCPDNKWMWGRKMSKGIASTKRAFIENFSWIKKRDFVNGGMFNERMNVYGGLSQITREQYDKKVQFLYDDAPGAIEQIRATRENKKREIWRAKEIIRKLYGW